MRSRPAVMAIALAVASPAAAQGDGSFAACTSQQKLQQVVGSQNRFTPDDCQKLTITRVQSGGTEFCVLDFGKEADAGFLDRLKQAAVPQQNASLTVRAMGFWYPACTGLLSTARD